jgi:hypothetical protein
MNRLPKDRTRRISLPQLSANRNIFGAILLLACLPSIAIAQEYAHETRFSVKFAGLEIGKARFDIRFDDISYSLKGSGETTGLVNWAAPATGSVESAGQLAGTRLKPELHKVSVIEKSKKPENLLLAFSGDRVSDIRFETTKPRKKRNAPKYVPVQANHMAKVLDPASSMIVPLSGDDARNGVKVCSQRFPVFDGETRYDISLSYKATKPVKTGGYDGHAYVCAMRYIPVAGHKKDHRTVREMAANKNMEIWLAPMQGVSVFTPIRIIVGTRYGRFDAMPEYFGKAG